MSKILITGGCSFSWSPPGSGVWPEQLFFLLEKHGYSKHINCALGSQGNGLISRKIFYQIHEALKNYSADDILVAVMWSNKDRMDYRCDDPDLLSFNRNLDGWIENPTQLGNNPNKNWVLLNPGWNIKESQIYYEHFYSHVGSSILSLEHILRLQYFLQNKKIKYFFTDFVDNNIVENPTYFGNEEIGHLWEQIDRNYYLPVSSEHRWIVENSETKEQYIADHNINGSTVSWIHPSWWHHAEFAKKVIYPWLIEKQFI